MKLRSMAATARSHRIWLALIAMAPGVLAPKPAAAQASVEIGPLVALFTPVGRHDVFSAIVPAAASDMRGLAWGAEGRFWLTPRFAIQLQGAVRNSRFGGGLYPPCMCCVPCLASPSAPGSATVVAATAQAVYRPSPTGFPFWVSAGVGMERRGGQAYADAVSGVSTPFAGVFGLGCDLHFGRRVTASLGATSLLYFLDTRDVFGQPVEHGFQADVLAHAGLAWHWGLD